MVGDGQAKALLDPWLRKDQVESLFQLSKSKARLAQPICWPDTDYKTTIVTRWGCIPSQNVHCVVEVTKYLCTLYANVQHWKRQGTTFGAKSLGIPPLQNVMQCKRPSVSRRLFIGMQRNSIRCINKFLPFFDQKLGIYCEIMESYVLFKALFIVLFFLRLARILIQLCYQFRVFVHFRPFATFFVFDVKFTILKLLKPLIQLLSLKGGDSCKWFKKIDLFLLQQNEYFEESEGLLYGAGIAD